jgi:large subunit ribosomal protein L18
MTRVRDRKQRRAAIKRRYRAAVRGTSARPRLAVFRSLRHVYAQIIDDEQGVTVTAASSLETEASGKVKSTGSRAAGKLIGQIIAERAKERGVEAVVFDRGGFSYHGVIQAIAEGAREAGLKF